LNILIYTQCFAPKVGGIESVMTNIAQQAHLKGHKVEVLADGSRHSSSLYDQEQQFKIKRFDQLKFLRKKIKSNFFHSTLKENKFDLIYFDSWKSLEHIDKNIKTKKICLVHGNEILNLKKKDRIKKSLSKANKIIFNSAFTQKLFLKNYKGFLKKKLSIIYPAFINHIKDDNNKKKYDLCTVARLEYRKGHHLILESLHKIKKNHNINFKYAILGNGPELSRLKDLVMKYNLINQVDFLESFSSTDEVYNYSKIHVMPTITTPDSIEGFGISNIEAASKGLPCIVSNSGGTPESIQDNGFIISENNVEELIDAILKVMKNLPKLSKKSLNFAKKFRDSSKIQEYLNCI
jgi:glycosyltransferase involved in cell wall biosynthesis